MRYLLAVVLGLSCLPLAAKDRDWQDAIFSASSPRKMGPSPCLSERRLLPVQFAPKCSGFASMAWPTACTFLIALVGAFRT